MKELLSGFVCSVAGILNKVVPNGDTARRLAHEKPMMGKHAFVKHLFAKHRAGRQSRYISLLSPFMIGIYNLAALRSFKL